MKGQEKPRFSPSDPGTSEILWLPVIADIKDILTPEKYESVIVISAHPDDESLSCGGLLQKASKAGIPTSVILCTWGEASHPNSTIFTPEDLAGERKKEMEQAISFLSSPEHPIKLTALCLPDGELEKHHDLLTKQIVDHIRSSENLRKEVHGYPSDFGATLVVAPWREDAHPDHEAAGRAAAAAAARTDAQFIEYPLWFWHWGSPASLSSYNPVKIPLTAEEETRKRQALNAHRSQIQPLSPATEDAAVLPPQVLEHFHRDHEVFFFPDHPSDDLAFERLHRDHPDPWESHSFYEQRKREETLAFLHEKASFENVLEIGCSVGELTRELSALSSQVDAIDPSPSALKEARKRTQQIKHVRLFQASTPHGLPAHLYDLIVLSEVGYFLSPDHLSATLTEISSRLLPGGYLLACHWSHPIEGWVLDGPLVHQRIANHPDFQVIHEQSFPDFDLMLAQVAVDA